MALDRLSNITRSGLGSVYTYDVGGIISTGVITATSFAGNITGNITGDVTGTATTATSLSGSPSITVTDITASGNVSIAGTLTYEDVTNIDSVGLSTFQNGIHVTGGSVGIGTDNPQLAPLHIGPNTYSLNLQNNSSNKSIILFTKNSVPNDARTSIEANGELNGHLAVTVGDSERLRITGIGSVGINQSDPQRKLHVKSGVNNNDGALRIESATSNIMDMGTDGTGHFLNCVNADPFRIKFAGTEKIRIGNNGSLATYQISNAATTEGILSSRGRAGRQGMNATTYGNIFNWNWTAGAAIEAWVDTTHVGNVTYTSDYRIKRNIQDQPDTGIDRVKQLRPVTYNGANFTISEMETQISVEDNILHEGFVAHEVGEVIPDGCVGEKDSDTQIQSLNLSAIISVVTKGLQEVITKLEALEARIDALEES